MRCRTAGTGTASVWVTMHWDTCSAPCSASLLATGCFASGARGFRVALAPTGAACLACGGPGLCWIATSALYGPDTAACSWWWSSKRSRRVLLLVLGGGASAPEGRTILPDLLHLHLPMRMYPSTSSQSLIRWPALPQNLQRGAFLCLPPDSVAWALTASWPAVVACRLALRAAIACRSTSLLKAAASAGAGEGVVRACRNASTERGSV
jgi:hypothetical protein